MLPSSPATGTQEGGAGRLPPCQPEGLHTSPAQLPAHRTTGPWHSWGVASRMASAAAAATVAAAIAPGPGSQMLSQNCSHLLGGAQGLPLLQNYLELSQPERRDGWISKGTQEPPLPPLRDQAGPSPAPQASPSLPPTPLRPEPELRRGGANSCFQRQAQLHIWLLQSVLQVGLQATNSV